VGEDRLERGQHAFDVLVRHHSHHADERREREGVLQRLDGRGRPVGVVRGVEQDRRRPADHLEAPRRGRLAERLLDHVVGDRLVAADEGLHRCQCERRVLCLVGTEQGKEDVVVLASQPLQGDHLAAHGGHPRPDPELQPLAGDRGTDLGGAFDQYLRDVGRLYGGHHGCPRLDDPDLLAGDDAGGVAQVLGVVDRDRGEHRDLGVHHVGGVPGTAHADLDDSHVDRRVGEGGVGHPHDRLEERERMVVLLVDQVGVGRHVVEGADERLLAERLAVDADPLGHRLQVRAGEAART
jgi:hypothetical protein